MHCDAILLDMTWHALDYLMLPMYQSRGRVNAMNAKRNQSCSIQTAVSRWFQSDYPNYLDLNLYRIDLYSSLLKSSQNLLSVVPSFLPPMSSSNILQTAQNRGGSKESLHDWLLDSIFLEGDVNPLDKTIRCPFRSHCYSSKVLRWIKSC